MKRIEVLSKGVAEKDVVAGLCCPGSAMVPLIWG